MSGISAVSMIGYMNNVSAIYQGQRLSAATKAKLEALGINTSNIKTEAEGKIKLQEALLERASQNEKTAKSDKNSKTDSALERAKWLAKKLNVYYSNYDKTDDIIYKIKLKVEEMLQAAGEDSDKKANAAYYAGLLEEVKQMQQSQLSLNMGMNISANMNIAFHGLY